MKGDADHAKWCAQQVERFHSLRRGPEREVVFDELVDALVQSTENEAHATVTVNSLIEDSDFCPTPAQIHAASNAHRAEPEDEPTLVDGKLIRCRWCGDRGLENTGAWSHLASAGERVFHGGWSRCSYNCAAAAAISDQELNSRNEVAVEFEKQKLKTQRRGIAAVRADARLQPITEADIHAAIFERDAKKGAA